MTPFSSVMTLDAVADGFAAHVPGDWLQGRTTYGGLSAALCVEAAGRAFGGLPPLRSAQFAFAGPASGGLRIETRVLRQGKSSVFAGVDLFGEEGLATRALLCFAAERESALAYENLAPPAVPGPEVCSPILAGGPVPAFMRHFDFRQAGGHAPVSGSAEPHYMFWIRHRDDPVAATPAACLALADAAPPTAMAMFNAFAPVSTMTWTVDFAGELFAGGLEWCLLESRAERVRGGYSRQSTRIWRADGTPLLLASQCVAVFV
ncbi:thioesterase family protein [Paludibacterium paludis]|uniref:Acyl-CoA thioesterase n=1 Tax=Paludibacterium paludis TaxID=1225769 RepID=A0A918P700_9NEIS|nr:thioesterase family protein [Paludibacterium paludis]GGY24896.1 acyl-CoA thioesterase [Paludibacterium paludis]